MKPSYQYPNPSGGPGGEPHTPPPGTGRYVPVQFAGNQPMVVYTIMGVTILVYLLQMGTEYLLGYDLPALSGMKINEFILQGQVWRLFTPMFLHGSILHILFNMYALYIFGRGLEGYYGHWRFLTLYVLSGFAGNVASFMFTQAPSLGSSTAIFGILGAEGVFLYQNRQLFGDTARRALSNLVMIAGINLFIGLSPGIDNWGHIGGLVAGTVFAWYAGPVLRIEGSMPPFQLVDQRERGDVFRSAIAVGVLFVVLTVAVFYLRLS